MRPRGAVAQTADRGREQREMHMPASAKTLTIHLTSMVLTAALALPAGLGVAFAEDPPSAQQIIEALKPARVTRGVPTSPADAARQAEETRFVDTLRNRSTRSITTEERKQIVSITKTKPSIDLEVNFDYDSATIGSRAEPQVTALGQALASADLSGRTFILAGYTDAKGGDSYNQGLSERRAEAVRRFLVEKYGIKQSDLVTVGYGKTRLKNSADPFSGENRRVQVVNVSDR
jgi:outer membrane protein OmpA-like peptidoglycan-associated protein